MTTTPNDCRLDIDDHLQELLTQRPVQDYLFKFLQYVRTKTNVLEVKSELYLLTDIIFTRSVDKNLQSFSSFPNIWPPVSHTLITHSLLLVSMATQSCWMIGEMVCMVSVSCDFVRQTNFARNFQQRRIREGSKVNATSASWFSMDSRCVRWVWSTVTCSVPSKHSYIIPQWLGRKRNSF